jgi:hypothetical protein
MNKMKKVRELADEIVPRVLNDIYQMVEREMYYLDIDFEDGDWDNPRSNHANELSSCIMAIVVNKLQQDIREPMRITDEEVASIADRLDDIVGESFHNAIWDTLSEREDADITEILSDEDIQRIKIELKSRL